MTIQTINKRKSFIIHKDSLHILKDMTNEQAGIFIKAIDFYQQNGHLPDLDFGLKMAIAPFVSQFERDEESYRKTCEARREAGSIGGKQKVANASKSKQKVANLADNKNKNDNDSKNKNKNFIAPTLQEIEAYCKERKNSVNPKSFHDYYSAGNWKDAKGSQVRNWKQKLLTWESRENNASKEGSQSNKFEFLTLFVNNLIGHTLIESIAISPSNKAVIRFKEKAHFDKYSSLEESLKNEVKKKISEELGTNGFEPKY